MWPQFVIGPAMSLTYDQKSEIRMAFDEAFVPIDRRRELRIRHQVAAQIFPWNQNAQGRPLAVQIEDFSAIGLGLVHFTPMGIGDDYLLTIPRSGSNDLVVVISVVRCVRRSDGHYHIGLELSGVMDRSKAGELVDALRAGRRITSRKTKLLFLLFGIVGIGSSLLIP